MSILQRRVALIRRYVLGLFVVVPLFFAQGTQPQAALVTDIDGLVTNVNGVLVDGLTYNIAFTIGTYDALFGGVFFPNAGNFVTAINLELNAPSNIPLIIFLNDTVSPASSYFLPTEFAGVNGDPPDIIVIGGFCAAVYAVFCDSAWAGPTTGMISPDAPFNYAVPTLISAVPLPAALPLFGSALAMLGIVGWRRKRRAAA